MEEPKADELLLAELDDTLRHNLEISGHCAQASFAALDEHFALGGGATLKALTPLPGIEQARLFEPEPARVYFWER